MIFTVNYTAKWRLKDNPNYVWQVCGLYSFLHTCRFIKKTTKGNKVGYWIGREFIGLNELISKIKLIQKEKLPF